MSELELENIKEGFAISDIAAITISTKDKKYLLDTYTEANFKAAVDAGEEKALRKQNRILALNRTDDIVKGYDVELTDVLIHPEVLALIEGGVSSFSAGGEFTKFSGPVAGNTVFRESVQLDIYCENLDTDGGIKSYTQFTLKNCKGKPTEFSIKDGDFWTPKYTIESRPKKGEPTIEIATVDKLPEVTTTP